jgi:hypothetical protein
LPSECFGRSPRRRDVAIDRAVPGGYFEGITLINRGGDYAFRRVSVMGSGR